MPENFFCNIWKVEHGSAALVITPNDKLILLDAGRSDSFSPAEHIHINGNATKIDSLVISHPHTDHLKDLPNVISLLNPATRYRNKLSPDRLVYPTGKNNLAEPMKSWLEMENRFTTPVSSYNDLKNSDNFGGVQFNTFCVGEKNLPQSAKENLNNYSLLTTISYRGLLLVFPGDLEPEGWDAVLDNTNLSTCLDGNIRILIAPHHGRRSGIRKADNSVYDRFLNLMQPNLVIISDVWGNESTDPEAYRAYTSGLYVESNGTVEYKNILTTKTNNCVSIQGIGHDLYVKVF